MATTNPRSDSPDASVSLLAVALCAAGAIALGLLLFPLLAVAVPVAYAWKTSRAGRLALLPLTVLAAGLPSWLLGLQAEGYLLLLREWGLTALGVFLAGEQGTAEHPVAFVRTGWPYALCGGPALGVALGVAWGVPVVTIDHFGKDAGKGAVGSFMKQARVRSGLTLERRKDGAVAATHHKTNFGPTLEPFAILPRFDDGDGEGHPAISAFRALPSSATPPALPPPASPAPPPTVRADDRPAPQQLPVREALHLVPPPVDDATDAPQSGNRGHAEIDARVLAAFRAHGGAIVSKEDIALELGYGIKTVHNACSRLKGRGLESPQPGQWRASVGAGAAQEAPA